MQNKLFKYLLISILFSLHVLGAGTYIKGTSPNTYLIEGFSTTASSAGTLTLTLTSETKQIITGVTTHTVVMPDATTLVLGRKFLIINKSSGTVTVNANGGGLLGTIVGGAQAELHLRTNGTAAGVWDLLSSSAGGGGTWGSITGTLGAQTDLQTALDTKVDESEFAAKGDILVGTGAGTLNNQAVGTNGQLLAADSTQTNGLKWIDPVNANNLIFDGDAEAGITNFVEGSYSAATRPAGTFTASSGSGTFAITTSSSSPLFGTNSFLLTKSSGASRQGRAIERTINIDSGYQTKMLKTRIDYKVVSGTFVAGSNGSSPTDSSLIWYVGQYNGSTWTYTEPSTFKMFSNSTTNSDWVEGEFQVNSDTTQLKLIGFISESANSAWVVKAEVGFRLSTYLAGTTITDWQSYTPTLSNLGTTTNVNGAWRRVGSNLEGKVTFTAGTGTGSTATIGLPSGLAMPSAPAGFRASLNNIVGDAGSATVGTGVDIIVLANPTSSTTTLTVGIRVAATLDNLTSRAGSDLSSTYFDLRFSVPISGWSSSVQVSDGYDGRLINGVFALSSATHTSTGNWQNLPSSTWTTAKDSTNSFLNGTYTVPSSGDYRVSGAVVFAANGTGIRAARIVAGGTTYPVSNGMAAHALDDNFTLLNQTVPNLKAGDTIVIQGYQNSGGNLSYSTNATRVIIEKLQAPTTISATEVVAASYTTSSQALGNGTVDTVILTVKDFDTHNAYSTSTGLFTCPVAGLYRVSGQATHGSRSSAVWDLSNYIYVNSTSKAVNNTYSAVNTVVHLFPPQVSKTVSCNTGDTISLRARAGYASTSLDGTATANHISIERIK